MNRKKICRNNGQKLPKFDKKILIYTYKKFKVNTKKPMPKHTSLSDC